MLTLETKARLSNLWVFFLFGQPGGGGTHFSSKSNFLLGTIGFWCHPRQLPKFTAQMAVAVKTTLQGDRHNGFIGALQQCLSPLDPLLQQILIGRQAQRLFQQATEVKLADVTNAATSANVISLPKWASICELHAYSFFLDRLQCFAI